jgi:hypothetical protein
MIVSIPAGFNTSGLFFVGTLLKAAGNVCINCKH